MQRRLCLEILLVSGVALLSIGCLGKARRPNQADAGVAAKQDGQECSLGASTTTSPPCSVLDPRKNSPLADKLRNLHKTDAAAELEGRLLRSEK